MHVHLIAVLDMQVYIWTLCLKGCMYKYLYVAYIVSHVCRKKQTLAIDKLWDFGYKGLKGIHSFLRVTTPFLLMLPPFSKYF